MGRKTDRIAALEQEVADVRAIASASRHAIEHALDALNELDEESFARGVGILDDALTHDPRPASPTGSLHWLHVVDGDRLLWRLVSELVELRDAEATRQGEPTLKHHRPASSQFASHPEAQEEWPTEALTYDAMRQERDRLRAEVARPPRVATGSILLLMLTGRSDEALGIRVHVDSIDWSAVSGWHIKASATDGDVARTLGSCPGEDSP